MGRNCFILGCKANKWRGSSDPNNKLPSFFRFPKSPSLLEEWKKVIPPREFSPRDPTEKDYLCSLHFKKGDVIKYYEIKSIRGCSKNEVVKIERGTWALKPGAIPCYFSNDNPDSDCLVRGVQRRATSERDSRLKTNHRSPEIALEAAETVEGVALASRTNTFGQDFDPFEDQLIKKEIIGPDMDSSQDTSLKSAEVAKLDHCYHLPSEQSVQISECNCVTPLPESSELSSSPIRSNNTVESLEQLSRNSCPETSTTSNRGKLKYDPYTIEQLHQDVLEIVLPKNWTFFQNDDDYSTEFIFYDKDMSVRSIKFSGSCRPCLTIRNTVMEHRRVNSRQDIEELLLLASVL